MVAFFFKKNNINIKCVTEIECAGQRFSPNDPKSACVQQNYRFMNGGLLQHGYMIRICACLAGIVLLLRVFGARVARMFPRNRLHEKKRDWHTATTATECPRDTHLGNK